METSVQTPTNKKSEIREKIRALEVERSVLENEIATLKEKVEVKELEIYSSSLENELGTLRIEKALLEEKVTAPNYAVAQNEDVNSSFSDTQLNIAETTAAASDIVQPVVADAETTPAAM